MKKITFITTGQPTTNPRLVKEAETLKALGYEVYVIFCFYQAWATEYDEDIISRNPGMYISCGGDPDHKKINYLKTRIRQKLCSYLFEFIKSAGIPENAISRTHAEALALAKTIKSDIYIAHNLGALPAAVIASRFHNAKVGYDAEDMHSEQFTEKDSLDYSINKYIEEKYFASLSYFTAASPLIAVNYQKTYNFLRPVVINNVFPKTENRMISESPAKLPLRLFWFSQTIGADRGLELIIEAMGLAGRNMELHLWGNCSDDYRASISWQSEKNRLRTDQIVIHAPVSPDEIMKIASHFDVGMASETGVPLNRDICLTNKVFTYLQCGLAIIASDTQAQSLFLEQYATSGMLYKKDQAADLSNCLIAIDEDRELLFHIKKSNYHLGQTVFNWENERLKFINLINDL